MAVAVWRWPCGGGRVAVAVWRWPCGGHMTCHVTWQDKPLRVTGKFRLIAGNTIQAEACYITPPFLKMRYAFVLTRAAVGSYVRVKYPFHFIKTWYWRPLTRFLKTRSTSHSSSLFTITAGGRKSPWRWFGKGSSAARFRKFMWNTLWMPGGVSSL